MQLASGMGECNEAGGYQQGPSDPVPCGLCCGFKTELELTF